MYDTFTEERKLGGLKNMWDWGHHGEEKTSHFQQPEQMCPG